MAIDSSKKKISDLLTRIRSVKIDSFTEEAEIEKFCNKIKDEYYHIQCDVLKTRERLMTVSSILDTCCSQGKNEKYFNDDMKYLIDKTLGVVNDFFSCEMAEKLIPFNIAKGKWLFERSRFDEALDVWEEVLKVNPDNEYIHSKLNEMSSNYEK